MTLEMFAFDMLTGRRLIPLPINTGDWAITTNADDTISCSLKADSPIIPGRWAAGLRSPDAPLRAWDMTPLARSGLLAVVDGEPTAAGPLWKRTYKQGGDIELTAGGLRSYWDRRLLLPVAARTTPLIDPVTGLADPSLDTNLSGLSYGTIAKRWVELVRLWPGGAIPMLLPADELGTREKNVAALDLKSLRDLLDNLAGLEAGPDISFRPRWAADGLGIYWEMTTGTNAKPRLGNPDPTLLSWSVGAPRSAAFDLEVEEDATSMTEEVFGIGGRNNDTALAVRARDTALYDVGAPLMQSVDASHDDVVDAVTLASYANRAAMLGKYPASFWKMKVRLHEKGALKLGDYWLGDMATVNVAEEDPVLDPGPYARRIASIGGTTDDYLSIVFAEALANG